MTVTSRYFRALPWFAWTALGGTVVRFLEGVKDGAGFAMTVPNVEKASSLRGSVSSCRRAPLGRRTFVGIFEIGGELVV